MIRHKNATIMSDADGHVSDVDVYECEKCSYRQFVFRELDKEQCRECGHNNHAEYQKFLKEQASVGYL